MADVSIRAAKPEDCDRILELIKELAEYENMSEGVKINADVLRKDGFGPDKYYHCLVADVPNPEGGLALTVGYALYFFVYSTWEGKSVWLEDFYVTPSYRSKGYGTALWVEVAKVAVEKGCSRMNFAVLNWNKPSIDYYVRQGAVDLTTTEKWHMFRLRKAELEKVAQMSR